MVREPSNRANLELVTIYEISKILSSSLDLSKTFHEVLNLLAAHLEIRRGLVILKHEDGALHLFSAVGLSRDEYDRGTYQLGEGIIGRILRAGMAVVVPDLAQEPLFLNRTGALDEKADAAVALIGVPIKAGGDKVGVLAIDRLAREHGRGFDDDVRFLSMVSNLLGQDLSLQRNVTEERAQLVQVARRTSGEARGSVSLDNVVGKSPRMQEVFAEVLQAAPSRATVLLRGESGTGKEVIARAVHFHSLRKDAPFVKLNCAALSETLLESELFGHEKGAFTGAIAERKGRFELAHRGTLFLDEIGDISPAFQAKLLRVIQEREFERVGGTRPIKVDVRLVFATNRDLEKAVSMGEFRADLYYRINVVGIFLPPLRERREDIPALVGYFLSRFNKDNARRVKMSPEALILLTNCFWPGNVRELENCIERTATMNKGDLIRSLNFPCSHDRCLTRTLHEPASLETQFVPLDSVVREAPSRPVEPPNPVAAGATHDGSNHPVNDDMPETERDRLVWAMEQCGWVQAKAARLLNITPRQIGYALQKYNIEVRKF